MMRATVRTVLPNTHSSHFRKLKKLNISRVKNTMQ